VYQDNLTGIKKNMKLIMPKHTKLLDFNEKCTLYYLVNDNSPKGSLHAKADEELCSEKQT
jgi:hypothetical protein